ncbi:MAG TPA: class I SAM-dependent methyltransferase [Acidothermaceae bacterium]
MTCVICGASAIEEVRPADIERLEEVSFSYSFRPEHTRTFRIVRCKACTHMFCAPLPARVTESYHDVVDEEYLKHAESRRLAAELVLRTVVQSTVGRSLLDVGCATGDFLEAGRQAGFEAEGVELSSWSCAIARQRGFVVHDKPLADFAKEGGQRFDVVSLIGVIEHFPDPRAEMENIAKLLRPGGIVVIWTGDASAWLPRLLGRRWWYWQGQHIQYFTQASMERLAALTGFEQVTTERYPFAATASTISNSLRRYPLHRVLSAFTNLVFKLKPVITLRLPGEMLFIARRK